MKEEYNEDTLIDIYDFMMKKIVIKDMPKHFLKKN